MSAPLRTTTARAMQDELRLVVQHAGQLVCAPATDAPQRARQWTVAWAISMLLHGGAVRVRDCLPGLHVDIRANHLSEHLPTNRRHHGASIREDDLDWESLEHIIRTTLDDPDCRQPIRCESVVMHCAIRQQETLQDADEPVAFTLQCRWPGHWSSATV